MVQIASAILVLFFTTACNTIGPPVYDESLRQASMNQPLTVTSVRICNECRVTTDIVLRITHTRGPEDAMPEVTKTRTRGWAGVILQFHNVSFRERYYGRQVTYIRGRRGILFIVAVNPHRNVMVVHTYVDVEPTITIRKDAVRIQFPNETVSSL